MLSLNEAIETLFAERVNIEVILTSDVDGYAFYNFRARPWKNSPNDGRMLLVGAPTLDECMIYLASALLNQSWVPLSWTARLHDVVDLGTSAAPTPIKFRARASESHVGPSELGSEYPYTK